MRTSRGSRRPRSTADWRATNFAPVDRIDQPELPPTCGTRSSGAIYGTRSIAAIAESALVR